MGVFVVLITILIIFVGTHNANQQCEILNDLSVRPFYEIKKCHRSDLPVISRINVRTLKECIDFAKERGGTAINFSPPGAIVSKSYQDYFFANCQVLGCPEMVNSSTLINDTTFDYYSLFGDLNALENSSCITSVGVFRIFPDKLNYTGAILKCQEIGGDLAHIVSEARTNGISGLVRDQVNAWYKTAYVGLDDKHKEGSFETPFREPLNCFTFRAWSPGHPRNKDKHEDCTIIDSESTWRVVNCRREFPFVCELYPMSPPKKPNLKNESCAEIIDETKRKKCQAKTTRQKSSGVPRNVTVTDRCSI